MTVPNCREETVTLLKYLKATAFAEEYQWWPPPVFILTLTLSQLVFFAIHAAHLVQAGGCAIGIFRSRHTEFSEPDLEKYRYCTC
jgi:hypothetical protein